MKISYDDLKFVIENSSSMADAARKLKISYKTIRKKTKELGLFKPNQSRKGVKRGFYENEIQRTPLIEILEGKHPFYGTSRLRKRLIYEGIKEHKCEECGIINWNGKDISLHLDHIDGDRTNHKIDNLRILCPNCHCQTDTFGSKNIKNKKYTQNELLKSIQDSSNFR